MNVTALVGVGVGLFGVGAALRALSTGTVTFVFARLLGGWGPTLAAEFDREESPIGYWASTALYGAGGLVVAALAGRALIG